MGDTGRKIYFCTNVYIEILEGNSELANIIPRLFGGWDWQNHVIVTSELTLAECLVKPIELAVSTDDYILHDKYLDLLLSQPGVQEVFSVTRHILIRAALVRAQLSNLAAKKIKLPDAIHVATALEAQCDTFVTRDGNLIEAVSAIIERKGLPKTAKSSSLKHIVKMEKDALLTLAEELKCP